MKKKNAIDFICIGITQSMIILVAHLNGEAREVSFEEIDEMICYCAKLFLVIKENDKFVDVELRTSAIARSIFMKKNISHLRVVFDNDEQELLFKLKYL